MSKVVAKGVEAVPLASLKADVEHGDVFIGEFVLSLQPYVQTGDVDSQK